MGLLDQIANHPGKNGNWLEKGVNGYMQGRERANANRLAETEMQMRREEADLRNSLVKKKIAGMEREEKTSMGLRDLIGSARGGDKDAMDELMIHRPEIYKMIRSGQMDERERVNEDLLGMIVTVEQSPDPAATYQQILPQVARMPGIDASALPAQYDPLFINQKKAQILKADEFYKSTRPKQPLVENHIDMGKGSQDLLKIDMESISKMTDEVSQRGRASIKDIETLNQLGVILEDIETGKGAQTKQKAKQLFGRFGIDLTDEDYENNERFEAISASLVLDTMQNQKGPQTEGDREFIKLTKPQLGKSKAANRSAIDYLKSRATIDSYYAGKMKQTRKIRNPQDRVNKATDLSIELDNVPAAVVVDGVGVTFNQYLSTARKNGMSMDETMESWIEVAR